LLGIRFQPGGAFPLFNIPMREITNQIVEFAAVENKT
jgi:hypothetical protein